MSDMVVPIVASKLRRPARPDGALPRGGLVRRLCHRPDSLWVVSGPAGFGKTTLIVDALEQSDRTSCWVTVDVRDRDPIRFWSHVAQAASTVGADVSDVLAALSGGSHAAAVDALRAALDIVDEPIRIVLDDLHLLIDESARTPDEFHELGMLIASPPSTTAFALTTRQELDLPVHRRRLVGDAVEIDARDLAFDSDDASDLFADQIRTGLLNIGQAAELVGRLGGWPAGIRLVQLGLRSGGVTPEALLADLPNAAADLRRYLGAEVLGALPSDIVDFATDVSILMELTPDACEAVTGRRDALAVLRRLAEDQVFIAVVDASVPTFRFHDVFREFLLDRLRERGPTVDLHCRAANWAAAHGDPDAVIHHAVEAGDHALAMRTMGAYYVEYSNAGRIETLWRWVSEIGAERVLGHPQISAMPAWMSLNRRRYDEIDPWIESIDLVDGLDQEHLDEFALQGEVVRSYRDRRLGDLDGALRHGRAAVDLVGRVDPSAPSIPSAHAVYGVGLALAGDAAAEASLLCAIEAGRAIGEDTAVVLAHGMLSFISTDPDVAHRHADAVFAIASDETTERFHQPSFAHLGRTKALMSEGRIGEADAALARAHAIVDLGDDPAVKTLADLLSARLAHHHGRLDEAREAARVAERRLESVTGSGWLDEQLRATRAAIRFVAADGSTPPGTVALSDREHAVLRLLPHGLSRRELAAQLFVSENTVKTHLTSIRHKLGVTGRADIVERAVALGILDEAVLDG